MVYVTNEAVLIKMGAKRTLVLRIRKRQLKFLGGIMKKEVSENLAVRGHIECKRGRGKLVV